MNPKVFLEMKRRAERAARRHQKGGLGPFAQQLAMFSLAPIVTDMASNVLSSVIPGLTGQAGGKFNLPDNVARKVLYRRIPAGGFAGQAGGKFSLPGNTQMIGLPNHLPPATYLHLPRARQKGKGLRKMTKRPRRRKSQQGGLGPLAAMAGMTLAPMLLNPLLAGLRR